MKTATTIDQLGKVPGPLFLAIGFFDGVHRGHCKVLQKALNRAKEESGQAWVLTFHPHPMRLLNPASAPALLTANEHKLRLLARQGLDGCLMLPFTRELSNFEPAAFIDYLQTEMPGLAEILVGRNWRFGKRGSGNTSVLSRLCRQRHLGTTIVSPVIRTGETISSTRIRSEILRGNLDEAAVLLGRPFSLLGSVIHGERIGRKLGCPTANLDVHNEVLPPHGVYAVHAVVDGTVHDAVLSYGSRPTFDRSPHAEAAIEVHLMDFDGDLYGKDLEVFFLQGLRPQVAYRSIERLRRQIQQDVRDACAVLNGKKLKESLYMPQNTVL